MVIREENPDRLVIDDRPVLIAALLGMGLLIVAGVTMALMAAGQWGGAAMLGLGTLLMGGAIAAFVRRTMLFLDRPSGSVVIRSTTVFGTKEHRHALSALRGAEVQTSRSGKGGPTHRPALLMSGGQAVPMTPVYTSGRGAGRAVEAVERWLAAGEATPQERA